MPQATFHFPRGFIWGTATSSHQVEGNNKNNSWWAWEQQAGHIAEGHTSGLACDWWGGRWREDFERAAELGNNAHRLSIEWSRVQPASNRWDEDALDYYREMVRGLRERGLTPLITLHHFTNPLWVEESGGWENPQIAVQFEKYTRKVVEALREYVKIWITINEPNLYALLGHWLGIWPPGKKSLLSAVRVFENILRAHAAAYATIHSLQPDARVGLAHHYRSALPARAWFPLDRLMRNLQSHVLNESIPSALLSGRLSLAFYSERIPEARGTQDFLGINYYTRELVSFNLLKPSMLFADQHYRPGVELSENGWIANEPEGLFEAIRWARRFGIPILVTENGVEDSRDTLRPRYMIEHIHQVWRAVNFNWPVEGYIWWSLIDNFEWERGWTQRFGLWELDPATQARRKRPSADLYSEICRENGISSEMVARYSPETFLRLFPG